VEAQVIHRPQGRAAAIKSVRLEDDDRNGAATQITTNPKTQTRAPMPAYRGNYDHIVSWGARTISSGKR
jgi:hypothetical protein